MKNYKIITVVCLAAFALIQGAQDQYDGRITGDSVQIRALGANFYERLGEFSRGTEVKVQSESDGWCEILLPPDTKLWIESEYINKDNTVNSDAAYLYAGQSTRFTKMRRLNKGTVLKVAGKPVNKMVPVYAPEGTTGWVSADFVEDISGPSEAELEAERLKKEQAEREAAEAERIRQEQELEAKKKAAEEERLRQEKEAKERAEAELKRQQEEAAERVRQEEEASRKQEAENLKAAELENTANSETKNASGVILIQRANAEGSKTESKAVGKTTQSQAKSQKTEPKKEKKAVPAPTTFSGIIVPLGSRSTSYAAYALCKVENNKYMPICYLSSKLLKISRWDRQIVTVTGIERKVPGCRYPVVEVQSIVKLQ